MDEIPKAYEPQAVEEKWSARWLADGCFVADPASSKPAYSIVIPPPNVTGVLTLGHVLNTTIQDILARRARMLGREVLWLPGTDHAGIATQTVVERKLRADEGKTRRDLGRDEFLKRIWEWKEKHGGIIIAQLKKLGCSCDWTRERFTMDADYSRAVQQVFVDLYKAGFIYRGKRMVNWDPAARTALSDEEVIMKPVSGLLYYVKYEIVDEVGTFLEVATTRPETIMGDTAVAVHPGDPRYERFVGKKCWRPFPRAQIPIIADEHIDPKFGTGVLKVTPAHDKNDFEIGERHGLEVRDVLNPDGTLNDLAGAEFAGMERFAARKAAAEMLRELGLLAKEEPYQNNVGYSERTDVPIEPRLSEQWFLRYPKVTEAREAVRTGEVRFRPDRWAAVYEHWMENIQDWCISRQLWWGHRIPVWYDKEQETYVGVEPPADLENWTQDPDVLDTWFSSWLWPFATMDDRTRAKFYPTVDLVTAPDIIFFWVARMIMAGFQFTNSKPFSNVFFTGLIRDQQGRKMSKSLGNSPDPLDLIAKYGADGLRFGLMRIAPQGQDIRFDEKQIEEGRNFANKLWNAARFRQMHGPSDPNVSLGSAALSIYSLDILSKLGALIARIAVSYDEYRFNEIAGALYEFFWSDYCDWYVEAAKTEIFSDTPATKESALAVMDYVLSRILRLLHPFTPHITEELWERFGFRAPNFGTKNYAMFAKLPSGERLAEFSSDKLAAAQKQVAAIYESVRAARNLRAEQRVPSNKKVRFVLRASASWIVLEVPTFTRLINATEVVLDANFSSASGLPRVLTPLGELYLPLDGVVDAAAERKRLDQEIVRVEAEIETVRRKLTNASFVNNAPAAVVEEHRKREKDWQEKLAQLRQMRDSLGEL
ncbi:MAG: valine--tRNA ligase [Verrucomicrobiota bacterium]|nr:valine--tRNA ligase [Verrucomicrobiota bacterium]